MNLGLAGMTALVCLAAPLSWAAPSAYFSSQDNLQFEIVSAIDHCQTSLEVAVFEFSSRPLAQALERAAKRGVLVRLLLEATAGRTSLKTDFSPNLEIRYLGGRRGGVMHHKFAILDNKRLVTGSFNWTKAGQYANHENVLLEDDGGAVSAYSRQFEDLWRQGLRRPGVRRLRARAARAPHQPRRESVIHE